MKDYRRRSRERESRNKRDDSRDRARRRRDVSLSPRRKGKVDDGRERSQKATNGAGNNEVSSRLYSGGGGVFCFNRHVNLPAAI